MKKKWNLLVVIFILMLVFPQIGFATIYSTIKGEVIDEETKQGIPNVKVWARHHLATDSPVSFWTMTDKDGYFSFKNLKPNIYSYLLEYYPLFPYAAYPEVETSTGSEYSFVLKEGENKFVVQKLKKGGKLTVVMKSALVDMSKYYLNNINIRYADEPFFMEKPYLVSHKVFNPAYVNTSNNPEIHAIAEGNYFIVAYGRRKKETITQNDMDLAGIVRTFHISKSEEKTIEFDFNSSSRLILDIKDKQGNVFYFGFIRIYKKLNTVEGDKYLKIWGDEYSSKNPIKPLIIESGEYYIDISCYLIDKNGNKIDCKSNEFLIKVDQNEIKHQELIINPDGNEIMYDIIYYN